MDSNKATFCLLMSLFLVWLIYGNWFSRTFYHPTLIFVPSIGVRCRMGRNILVLLSLALTWENFFVWVVPFLLFAQVKLIKSMIIMDCSVQHVLLTVQAVILLDLTCVMRTPAIPVLHSSQQLKPAAVCELFTCSVSIITKQAIELDIYCRLFYFTVLSILTLVCLRNSHYTLIFLLQFIYRKFR